MRRNYTLDKKQREYRNKTIRRAYKETEFSLEDIGRIYKIPKQAVSIILKNEKQ